MSGTMKRFYKDAAAVPAEGGFAVHLDGRPVRTPARALLTLPTAAMGEAVAAEWAAQDEEIDPRSMTATGFANAAIDQIAPNHAAFAAGVARYGESDLLCYRAENPVPLVARQAAEWDPLIDWARDRYDIAFRVTAGILPVDQPPETIARLSAVVAAFDPFMLAGLSTVVSIGGSLICGLALVEGGYDQDAIWAATELDELWQAEQWGEDADAVQHRERRRAEFDAAAGFCRLAAG
jgi:chaperone required for assembly of F1-ATPase